MPNATTLQAVRAHLQGKDLDPEYLAATTRQGGPGGWTEFCCKSGGRTVYLRLRDEVSVGEGNQSITIADVVLAVDRALAEAQDQGAVVLDWNYIQETAARSK